VKHKEKGFLLFEFFLTSLLGSLLLLIFYQTYKAIGRSTKYIAANADYETGKNAFYFYLENDCLRSRLPFSFRGFFGEKDKKKRELFFREYIRPCMPVLKKNDKEISFSFVTSNKRVMKDITDSFSFILVRYAFEKSSESNQEREMYRLVRYEGLLDDTFTVKEEKRSLLLETVLDPQVFFIVPDEKGIQESSPETVSKKNKKDRYNQWEKKPCYKHVDVFAVEEKETKSMAVPFSIFVEYTYFSRKNDKAYTSSHLVTFPSGAAAWRALINEKEDTNESKT
jgi:hypothetical protein